MTENNATDQSASSTPYEAAEVADVADVADGPEPDGIPSFDAAGLAARYGIKQEMSKVRKMTLGIVAFAILAAVAVYIGLNQANPKIQATVISYSVSGNSITVTFEVDKSASQAAECTLQAEDIQGNVIGSANVTVPSGRAKEDEIYTVNSTGAPNTVLVSSCTPVA